MEVTGATFLKTKIFIFALAASWLFAATALGQDPAVTQPKTIVAPSDAFLASAVNHPLPVIHNEAKAVDAKAPQITGVGQVEILVGEDGNVIYARFLSGPLALAEPAIEAVRAWRWEPVLDGGSPVRVIGRVAFVLGPKGSISVAPVAAPVPAGAENVSLAAIQLFKEEAALLERLALAPEFSVRVDDSNGSPLAIDAVKLRAVKRDPDPLTGNEPINDYAISGFVSLRNTTGLPVTPSSLRFTNQMSGQTFDIYLAKRAIPGQNTYTHFIRFMVLSGDPSNLSVGVVGASAVEDVSKWSSAANKRSTEVAPHSAPEIMPRATPAITAVQEQVDTLPLAITRPRPNYSEEARRNGVTGVSRLRILIAEDGSVKNVVVVTTLPDLLTEQAIAAAKAIRFKPAMKNGNPVAHWVLIEVEFNLR